MKAIPILSVLVNVLCIARAFHRFWWKQTILIPIPIWALGIVLPISFQPWVFTLTCTWINTQPKNQGDLCADLQNYLSRAPFSLVLCSTNSHCLDSSNSDCCLLNPVRQPDFICILPAGRKLSIGSELMAIIELNLFVSFLSRNTHSPILPIIQYLKTVALFCLFVLVIFFT